MHEYSIVSALMERVEAEARAHGATDVRRIRVTIGELSGVEPELLATAFETFRDGTLCANTKLEIERIEAGWVCPQCGGKIPRGEVLTCGTCRVPAKLQGGDEIILERIEMEVA